MALTRHQEHHVRALLSDAPDMPTVDEHTRVAEEANALLDGTSDWPDLRLTPKGIHDWTERPDERDDIFEDIRRP